jgi:hypothetical protein
MSWRLRRQQPVVNTEWQILSSRQEPACGHTPEGFARGSPETPQRERSFFDRKIGVYAEVGRLQAFVPEPECDVGLFESRGALCPCRRRVTQPMRSNRPKSGATTRSVTLYDAFDGFT